MPALIIDGQGVTVAPGTRVIDAAEALGIMIPRFCYLKPLGAVGACRMCAVEFTAGPVHGLQMSCLIEAKNGMVVETGSRAAQDFRRLVIEWLMANHPHDCPVCDEGGQCLLQDETVSSGHAIRRYPGRKRAFRDQYLGAFVQQEMNRCIHCYRCSRFYQEFCGYRDLGVMQIGSRVFFGRFADGALESPFAGNLVDICPTGVYTDKPARFKRRPWDLQSAPAICPHCSLGCNTLALADYREMIRQEARVNEHVNGYFICDRGRFGLHFAGLPERPRQPRIGDEEVGWEEALRTAAARLKGIAEKHGPAAIAALGSTRGSLETMVLLKHCCSGLGWQGPHYFCNPDLELKTRAAVATLEPELALSMAELEQRDFIVVLGADPINEAPMLALGLRQAVRNGAMVVVLDPRPVFLPFAFTHLALTPDDLEEGLSLLVSEAVKQKIAAGLDDYDARLISNMPPDTHTLASTAADTLCACGAKLAACQRPAIICGTDLVRKTTPAFVAEQVRGLRKITIEAGLFYVLTRANAFSAAMLADPAGVDFGESLAAIEDGRLKALLVAEADPFWQFPDRQRLNQAIAALDLLIVLDHLPTNVAGLAHILLPSANQFESGASFINQEGRLQYSVKVHEPGLPLSQLVRDGRPPHQFTREVPGGAPRPAWQVLNELFRAIAPEQPPALLEELWQELGFASPGRENQVEAGYPVDGIRLTPLAPSYPKTIAVPAGQPAAEQPGFLDLLLVDWTYGTEELAAYSAPIRQAESEPHLCMHSADAAGAGLADGDRVILHLDRGILEITLKFYKNMARGVAILPRHRRIAWQQLQYRSDKLPICRIEKVPLTLSLSRAGERGRSNEGEG